MITAKEKSPLKVILIGEGAKILNKKKLFYEYKRIINKKAKIK